MSLFVKVVIHVASGRSSRSPLKGSQTGKPAAHNYVVDDKDLSKDSERCLRCLRSLRQ